MAGNYPDAPSRRMAWDADGTVALWRTLPSGTLAELTTQEKTDVNGEQHGDNIPGFTAFASQTVYFVFPELRELDGVFFAGFETGGAACTASLVESSADTTNGVDGSWSTQIANINDFDRTIPDYRDDITSIAVATESGLRIETATAVDQGISPATIHIYGEISPGETPDRLLFLDTENSDAEFTKVLDFGDVPRGQTTERTFKLINNSASKSINTIQITAEDLFLNAGDWYEFGDDGIAYQATHSIGNLANGAEELVYLKQVIPGGETLGVQAGRIKVSHDSVT